MTSDSDKTFFDLARFLKEKGMMLFKKWMAHASPRSFSKTRSAKNPSCLSTS